MQRENRWLKQVLAIEEGTPYHSNLTAEAEPPFDDPCSGDVAIKMDGIAVFRLENGCLTFRFYVDDRGRFTTGYNALAAQKMTLHVPSRSFSHPAMILGMSGDATSLGGIVNAQAFGDEDAPLKGVTVWFSGIPQKWFGTYKQAHYEVVSKVEEVQIKENGTTVVPSGRLGATALAGFELEADGWKVDLTEIPISLRSEPSIAHVCNISKENGRLTGAVAQDFLNENLFPFLDFTFGQNTRSCTVTGWNKDGKTLWVRNFSQNETPRKTNQNNWFLRYARTDPSPLFQHFYDLTSDTKRHWRKVIDQYADSEEIMGTFQKSALAASVSFAALEGLARSIISTYEPEIRKQWLKRDLSLAPPQRKGIIDAIEMVAERELGPHSKIFREASKQIAAIRNATFHTDLTAEEDPVNAYYRWNASQALVEILLLSKMGLTEIINRTAFGKFNVMGKDVYADVRKEELNFR